MMPSPPAKLLIAFVAIFVVWFAWFFALFPTIFTYDWQASVDLLLGRVDTQWRRDDLFMSSWRVVGCVIAGLMLFLSTFILLRKSYFLAMLPVLICVIIFLFPFSGKFRQFHWEWGRWQDPIVKQTTIEPFFFALELLPKDPEEYKNMMPIEWLPQFSFPRKIITAALYCFTPTFLFGFFACVILCQKDVRKYFKEKKPLFSGNDAPLARQEFYRTLMRYYGILLALFGASHLPSWMEEFIYFFDYYGTPKPGMAALYMIAFLACVCFCLIDRLRFLAVLSPFICLATIASLDLNTRELGFFRGYSYIVKQYSPFVVAWGSRLAICMFGLWIWWKLMGCSKVKNVAPFSS